MEIYGELGKLLLGGGKQQRSDWPGAKTKKK
jgi:hypothetical protein